MITLSNENIGAVASICSNLAKACEKQHRAQESKLFLQIEQYFNERQVKESKHGLIDLEPLIQADISQAYVQCEDAAVAAEDRASLRAVTWGKKVTAIHKSLLSRYAKQQEALLDNGQLYLCEACGFIAISAQVPDMCPICKAPASRFVKIQ
ncbi:MAG: rubredoxin [Spirochaetales bacterium]|nr:rubredoxin [Spirochaetales bacterium]